MIYFRNQHAGPHLWYLGQLPGLRWVAYLGLGACLFLAFWVDARVWAAGSGLIVAGLVWHAVARRR